MLAKYLSYLWPITTAVKKSDINGELRVTWYNGKKTLDSKNTNYSYGVLQKVLNHGLEQINFNKNKNALVLGMGVGSVIASLRDSFDFHQEVTAVENDPLVIQLALEEFNLLNYEPLDIHRKDAFTFVKSCSKKFGLIIIDIFQDTEIPLKFYKPPFWNYLLPLLEKNGVVLFNSGITQKAQQEALRFQKAWQDKLKFKSISFQNTTNYLLEISKAT